MHTVVRLVRGTGAASDPSCGRLAVAVGIGYAPAVGAGGIAWLHEDRGLLGDHWAADISGFGLDADWACLALGEGGAAVVAFWLWLAVGELVPYGLALFEYVFVFELEFLKVKNL